MKTLAHWIVTVALAVACAYLLFRPRPVRFVDRAAVGQTASPKEWVDSSGNSHQTFELSGQNIISKSDLRSPDKPAGIIDTAARLLSLARDKIVSAYRMNVMTRDSLLQARKEINRLTSRLVYVYNDKYVNLKYTPPIDTSSVGTFDFAYNNEISVTQYQKRGKFLGLPIGSKKSFIDIQSKDPRTKINGFQALTVEQEQPTFGLRIQGNVNYNPQTGSLGFGPGARFDAGRFSFQGNYTWYPESGRWRPSVNANFDLIRF